MLVSSILTVINEWLRQRKAARAIVRELSDLDDHMLDDIGIHRWQIPSVSAGAATR